MNLPSNQSYWDNLLSCPNKIFSEIAWRLTGWFAHCISQPTTNIITVLPEAIAAEIQSRLNVQILKVTPLHGGDINSAACIELDNGEKTFIKWNLNTPSDMFETEADGLELLATAESDLIIPEVKLLGDQFLMMEFKIPSKIVIVVH